MSYQCMCNLMHSSLSESNKYTGSYKERAVLGFVFVAAQLFKTCTQLPPNTLTYFLLLLNA